MLARLRAIRPRVCSHRTVAPLQLSTGCLRAFNRGPDSPAYPDDAATAEPLRHQSHLPEPRWLRVPHPFPDPPRAASDEPNYAPPTDEEFDKMLHDVFGRLIEAKSVKFSFHKAQRRAELNEHFEAAVEGDPQQALPATLHDGTDLSIPEFGAPKSALRVLKESNAASSASAETDAEIAQAVEALANAAPEALADEALSETPVDDSSVGASAEAGASAASAPPPQFAREVYELAGDVLIRQVMPPLRAGNLARAFQVIPRHQMKLWRYLLSNLGRRGQISDQRLVWEAITDPNTPLDPDCCSIMIATSYRYCLWEDVVDACRLAHDAGALRLPKEWLMWIHALGRLEKYKRMSRTFRVMVRDTQVKPTPSILAALMLHHGRAGNVLLMLKYFARYEKYDLKFGTVDFSVLVNGLCFNGYANVALKLLETAQQQEVPGAHEGSTIAPMLSSLVHAGEVEKARALFARTPAKRRTQELYGSYMKALVRSYRNEDVVALYAELMRDHVAVNEPIFRACIKSLTDPAAVSQLVRAFRGTRKPWTLDTYTTVIRTYAMRNKRLAAEKLLEEVVQKQLPVTTKLVFPFIDYMLDHEQFGDEAVVLAQHFRYIRSPDGSWSCDLPNAQRNLLPEEWTALRHFIRKTQWARRTRYRDEGLEDVDD
eukprot:TRINITY_DN22827_c0_g1_i1.p1 TRINITY_DN22827_c0_g1~~TRINITY_DN22827_c0_g1_i1.p1  ORF type:complete len:657 (-),score=179.99 TRINITY_DN22827_c0_g1_i1:8-1978(-)